MRNPKEALQKLISMIEDARDALQITIADNEWRRDGGRKMAEEMLDLDELVADMSGPSFDEDVATLRGAVADQSS